MCFLPLLPTSDMESCGEDGEICVKLAANLLEPEILVKMAPGNRSQNFIDEVFRAAQSKSCHISWKPLLCFWITFFRQLKKQYFSVGWTWKYLTRAGKLVIFAEKI